MLEDGKKVNVSKTTAHLHFLCIAGLAKRQQESECKEVGYSSLHTM